MTRRGNGEGTIYKRGDGRWQATISVGAGKRRSFYGKTRELVRQRMVAALHARDNGMLPAARSESLGAFLTTWLEDLQVRPLTATSYRAKLEQHVIPTLGRIPLHRLRPDQVNALLREKAKTLSPQSVHHIRAVLRTALNRGVRWGLIPRNVAALAEPPRVEQYDATFLNVEEARAFLDAARGDRLEALYTVALSLGLRQGEALGLRWDCVDLDRRALHVTRAMQRIPGQGLQLVEPKTKRSRRTLVMPEGVARSLRAHRARQLEDRMRAGELWQDHGLIFATAVGRPLAGGVVVNGSFRRITRAAGSPSGLRFHDLRHSCASLLLAQGIAARTVMDVLGHSTLAMTTRYQHVASELMSEAASAMDRALGS